MTEFYLITGFLGAGKTTFLKNIIKSFDGKKLCIIVNEFGKEGVDGKLLSESGIALSEITGGSIFCACRMDQFESALSEAVLGRPDVLLVEASGLSDPTGIYKLLSGERWGGSFRYRGCICVADAVNLPKVYQTARVCKKQLSMCDIVLVNKTDIATEEQLQATREIVLMQRPDAAIFYTSFGRADGDWLQTLRTRKDRNIDGALRTADINLHSLTITVDESLSPTEFTAFLANIAEDTYRIKGFLRLSGKVYLADCVGSLVNLREYCGAAADVINRINVLYGYGLPAKKSVAEAAVMYPGKIVIDAS
jgi:G3E family GTPase